MASIADVFFKALLDDSQLEVDVKKAGDKHGQALGSRFSSGLKQTLGGAALGGFFTAAVESGVKFEDQLRTINTVAKVSDDQLAKIGDDIQQLSRDSGKTTDDLTQGFYDLVSAGVPADKAINVLRDSAVLATGALGTTSESVDLVTSALGAYGLSADKSARVTDIFAQAVADGKTTVAALAGGISQVAPIAASAGISLEEVAAATSIMTLKGDTAAQAMTRIKNAISALLTPNATLNTIQERTGINFAKLAADKGLAVALEELRKATKGNNEEFAKALGSSEALTLAFSVTGDNAAAMATELGRVQEGADKGGVALSQYTEKSKSASEQGKRLVATIQTFIQDVGGPFVNSVGPAVFAINQLGGAFGKGGLLAKAFGAVLGGLTANVIPAIGRAFAAAELGTRAETLGLRLQTALIKGLTVKDRFVSALQNFLDPLFERLGETSAGKFATRFLASSAVTGLGSKIAAVVAASFAVAPLVIPFVLIPKIQASLPDITGKDINKQAADAFDRIRSGQPLQAAGNAGEALGESFTDGVKTGIEAGHADIAQTAEKYGDAMVNAAKAWKPTAPALIITKVFGSDLAAQSDTAKAYGRRMAAAAAAGIVERVSTARSTVDQAWQALVDGLKNELTPTKERANLIGQLASKELAKGLKSKDPELRAQAQVTRQTIIDRLNQLGANAKNIGKAGMDELRKAMKSKDPEIRAAARSIYTAATQPIAALPSAGATYGRNLVTSLIAGMNSRARMLRLAAQGLAAIARDQLAISSPAKEGPWSERGGPEGWGERFGSSLARGIESQIAKMRAVSRAFAAAGVPSFTAPLTPAFAAPTLSSMSVPMAASLDPARLAPVTRKTDIHVNVEGLLKAKDPFDVARTLGRFARAGVFDDTDKP